MLEGNSLPPKGSKRLLHYYRFEVTKERNSIIQSLCSVEQRGSLRGHSQGILSREREEEKELKGSAMKT